MNNMSSNNCFVRSFDCNLMKLKIYISCNACKRREIDSLLIKKYLQVNGCEVVESIEVADIVLFFTCSFSKEMSFDSYTKLSYYQDNFRYVFVFGCFPIIGMHELKLKNNVVCIKNEELNEIEKYFPPINLPLKQIKDGNDIYFDPLLNDTVFLIRISRGCYGSCSYCAIKNAIGAHKSKPFDAIKEEVDFAICNGCKYIRLIADDGGGYGLDMGLDIIWLLAQISEYKTIKGIDFEINPKWLLRYKEQFLDFVKVHYNLSLKITIPIQSFSQDVLRHMNRFVNIGELCGMLTELKSFGSRLFMITHIIIGYPLEKQEDLDCTIHSLVFYKFDQINLFPFTLHPCSPLGELYKTWNFDIQNRSEYVLGKLCSYGYEIFEASKSDSGQWQHAILRLK